LTQSACACLSSDVFQTEQTSGCGLVYFARASSWLKRSTVETEYDVFEILLNRSVKWHLCVREKQRALNMLKALGSRTFNECFATDLETHEIIARVNNGNIASQAILEDYTSVAI
jgi:hypothetical protein